MLPHALPWPITGPSLVWRCPICFGRNQGFRTTSPACGWPLYRLCGGAVLPSVPALALLCRYKRLHIPLKVTDDSLIRDVLSVSSSLFHFARHTHADPMMQPCQSNRRHDVLGFLVSDARQVRTACVGWWSVWLATSYKALEQLSSTFVCIPFGSPA